jgi:hypothetical protein
MSGILCRYLFAGVRIAPFRTARNVFAGETLYTFQFVVEDVLVMPRSPDRRTAQIVL